MLLSGCRPCRYYFRREECSHRLPPDWASYRARCMVCVGTSSLSSLVIDGFNTLPRSIRGLRSHVIVVIACYCRVSGPVVTTIARGMSTPWVVFARERRDRFCGRVMLLAVLYKSCVCSSVRADIALPSSGIRRCPCYCTERRSLPLVRECAPADSTLLLL